MGSKNKEFCPAIMQGRGRIMQYALLLLCALHAGLADAQQSGGSLEIFIDQSDQIGRVQRDDILRMIDFSSFVDSLSDSEDENEDENIVIREIKDPYTHHSRVVSINRPFYWQERTLMDKALGTNSDAVNRDTFHQTLRDTLSALLQRTESLKKSFIIQGISRSPIPKCKEGDQCALWIISDLLEYSDCAESPGNVKVSSSIKDCIRDFTTEFPRKTQVMVYLVRRCKYMKIQNEFRDFWNDFFTEFITKGGPVTWVNIPPPSCEVPVP